MAKLDNRRHSQCNGWQQEVNRLTRKLYRLQDARATAVRHKNRGRVSNLDAAIDNAYKRIHAYQNKIDRNCNTSDAASLPNTNNVPTSNPSLSNTPEAKRAKKKVLALSKKDTFTQSEIAYLWIALGGDPSKALTASAVSFAESSGNRLAGNYCCHGLWAIYLTVNNVTLEQAQDPLWSTRWAIRTQKQLGWQPWEVYTNGMYQQFMGTHITGVSELTSFGSKLCDALPFCNENSTPTPGNVIQGASDAADGIGDVAGAISDVFQALTSKEFWLKAGKVILGVLLLAFAANALLKALLGVDAIGTGINALTKGTAKTK